MWKNYLKVAWRNLLKHKLFSFINIFGLAVGMACCLLMMLFIEDELSYDQHFTESEQIYRLTAQIRVGEKTLNLSTVSAPIAYEAKQTFTDIVEATRLISLPMVDKSLLKVGENASQEKTLYATDGFLADSTFFNVFDYEFLKGDRNTALHQPNSIVIADELAEKLFGKKNPLNQPVKVSNSFGEHTYTVKGVFNAQENTHIPAKFIITMRSDGFGGQVVTGEQFQNWATNNMVITYFKVKKNTDTERIAQNIDDLVLQNGSEYLEEYGMQKTHQLQPLEDIYLKSDFEMEETTTSSLQYLYITGAIAAFTLLIACINFMNLTTARSSKRAHEVGVRKVMGAVRNNLIKQFLGESLLMSGLALLIACGLVVLFLPLLNSVSGKVLTLSLYTDFDKIVWLVAIALLTGVLAGSYPALYLSGFNPVKVLKGKLLSTYSATVFRKGLIVFQFVIAICLIISTVFINQQMQYLFHKDLGFQKDQKLIIPIHSSNVAEKSEVYLEEIRQHPQVKEASAGSTYPGSFALNDIFFFKEGGNKEEGILTKLNFVDYHYLATLDIPLRKGRYFSKAFATDTNAIILNEQAVKKIGLSAEEIVGQNIYYSFGGEVLSVKVIGVVKDFHYESLHKTIAPYGFMVNTNNFYTCIIANINTQSLPKLLSFMEEKWQRVNADVPFEYTFLDQEFGKKYAKEERMLNITTYFTIIAVLISCLGLYGLTTFTVEQKMKEIGLRKVLGASVPSLVWLLAKGFMKLVLIAFLLAAPIGYLLMDQWLNDFAFRIDMQGLPFLIAGLLITIIAVSTVSVKSIRAARGNPIDILKYE
ncbi:MAG: ABC transporter permease [Thermonemataceae bacterium]